MGREKIKEYQTFIEKAKNKEPERLNGRGG